MKKMSSKRAFGFGFDRASHSTGNAFLKNGSRYCNDPTITATQHYRHDIRDAVRDIFSQATS